MYPGETPALRRGRRLASVCSSKPIVRRPPISSNKPNVYAPLCRSNHRIARTFVPFPSGEKFSYFTQRHAFGYVSVIWRHFWHGILLAIEFRCNLDKSRMKSTLKFCLPSHSLPMPFMRIILQKFRYGLLLAATRSDSAGKAP